MSSLENIATGRELQFGQKGPRIPMHSKPPENYENIFIDTKLGRISAKVFGTMQKGAIPVLCIPGNLNSVKLKINEIIYVCIRNDGG
jgi:hypothetical protein